LRAPLVPYVRLRARLGNATGWRRISARDGPCGPPLLWFGSSRGFTGQGPDGFRHPAPLAAIPRGESFAPTRSARTPRVVSSWRRRLEADDTGSRRTCWKHASPVRLRAHLASPLSRCPPQPPGDPLTRGRRAGKNCLRSLSTARMVVACADTIRGQGPPHPILREEDRDPLHPRCLPSMGCPVRDRMFSTACLQPVENLRRLCDPRPPLPPLTGR
jgi:hypothetical protein